jgi:hypothetical protein
MGPTFGFGYVPAIVNWEEDVGGFGEVGEGVAEGSRVGGLEEHEGHAWAEEDDVGVFEFGEVFVFEVSINWQDVNDEKKKTTERSWHTLPKMR